MCTIRVSSSCSTSATMTWLTVMEYLRHKLPWICSTCRKQFLVLSSFMTYHQVCNYINTTGATSGAGTAYPNGGLEYKVYFIIISLKISLFLP
jgi:hypothetical protein